MGTERRENYKGKGKLGREGREELGRERRGNTIGRGEDKERGER